MASAEGKESHNKQHGQTKFLRLKMLLLIILTNLFTIYIYTTATTITQQTLPLTHQDQNNKLSNTTLHELAATRFHLLSLQRKLASTNQLLEVLLTELHHAEEGRAAHSSMPDEVKLALGPHKLPLGYSPRSGSDELHTPVGGACLLFPQELAKYMTYQVGGECPSDDVFAQKFMLKGCEPLPRRRCHPKSPRGYVEPAPIPESLWATPQDTSIVWDPYTCKNYTCLIERRKARGFYDCKDCFNLRGRERTRWLFDNGGLDYSIDHVLGAKRKGTIRIGLDIGGGTGTFAARMRERNITIISSTMNLDGPFNSFIASRGLIPMHLSVSHRLPFFENTLDIVHSMHVLSNWIPDPMLELTLYDIYRVLRPGGLFWLDHFFCTGAQLNATYVPMLDRVGFKKLRWNEGMKLDRGIDKNEWYFSALLEKPMT